MPLDPEAVCNVEPEPTVYDLIGRPLRVRCERSAYHERDTHVCNLGHVRVTWPGRGILCGEFRDKGA